MKALGHMVSEKIFFYVFPIVSLRELLTPRVGAISDPRGMLGRIYVKLQCCIPNIEALAVVVSEKKIFSCIFHCKPMADNDAPRVGPVWTPGPRLAGFINRTTIHCYTQNMKALGLVVSEKKTFFCFSHDAPGMGSVWTPGARLAGLIKRTTIH